MDFHAHIQSSWNRKKAQRLCIVGQHEMGRVLNDNQLMLPCHTDNPLVKLPCGHPSRGAVGLVQNEKFRLVVEYHLISLAQIRAFHCSSSTYCTACKSTGYEYNQGRGWVTCTACKGRGRVR